jgi:thiamine phosphate synthase YjbQ (UPF0047 family)
MTEKLKHSVMKTLKIFALITALLTGTITVNASENSDSADISKQIQSTIQVPEQLQSSDAQSRVLVVFSIDENGLATVHEIGSDDANVRRDLAEQFAQMLLKGDVGMYSIWLNFKTL